MPDNAIAVQTPQHLQPKIPLPMELWRDPQTVSPEELAGYIQVLEKACLEDPQSADLRTCLGVAYAMNYEVYKSMDALEVAIQLEPEHFFAQLKQGELLYRLRALARAEEETRKAVDLARNPLELAISRKQLQEIRKLRREGIRDLTWNRPLTVPALIAAGMMLMVIAMMYWK
jgi:tetratricopeptide (TPR) repeat protein